ncbi:MAG TPA: efflux RND transporter periplasmic adaptor subunit [Planctomycetaceae bacterium]|nr:efflux RND transporter periplasmic adaptor subunit [Planctomycetaceae bacterium]
MISPLVVSLAGTLLLPGCSDARSDSASERPPPAIVTAGAPVERSISDYVEYTGRIDAVETVEVRARVTGFLTKVWFVAKEGNDDTAGEGAEVKAGEPLYQIDDREYKADLEAAEGELAVALAQLEKATGDLKRAVALKEKGSISAEEYERNDTAKKQAAATVISAKAKRDRAELNVEFSSIAAPISGKISRTQITAGNLIQADNTLLTTIVSVDPVNVFFDVDERTILAIRKLMREGKIRSGRHREAGDKETFLVEMGLATDQGYPKNGYIDFVDNRVDPATGTLRVRGVFENPAFQPQRREMTPGMFARVRVPLSEPHPALLVAERAIGSDQGRKFVYVVNEKKEVVDRTVRLGPVYDRLRVITEGLKPGEQVIIDGMQRVRPGVEVTAKPAKMDGRPGMTEADASADSASPPGQDKAAKPQSSSKQSAD